MPNIESRCNQLKLGHPLGRRLRQYRRRTSVYSYLLRLSRQGLLERVRVGTRLAYRLTPRGIARLFYFRERRKNRR